jgi:membrane-associated phospholipid phosphatase
MKLLAVACLLAATAANLLGAGQAAADPEPQAESDLHWDPSWPQFRPLEYVVTGVTGVTAIAMYIYLPPQREPHWIGGILFDDAVRDALRVRSIPTLRTVRTASDAIGVTAVVLTVGVDSFAVPLLRGSPKVAVQLTLMDFEAFALSSIVTFSLYDSVGRARPSYLDCQRNFAFDPSCNLSPTASFPSGHADQVFTAAGLSCVHHAYLPLYGDPLLDALACARDVALATADGVLRVMGDRHYTTDVLAGGAIGFAFGYGLPVLLHYAAGGNHHTQALSLAPLTDGEIGLTAAGEF